MTNGEIAELREAMKAPLGLDRIVAHHSAFRALPRLLAERGALLEALDSIIGQVEDGCVNDCGICRFCVCERVARKAQAFAGESM